jgi:hypothetical protein
VLAFSFQRLTATNTSRKIHKTFYMWGLDCHLIEASEFANLSLSTREELATTITDSLTQDLATLHG